MFTAVVDVGKLVHTFPERYLKLSSTCSIRLTYPPDFSFPTASSMTGLVLAGGLWIARGNGLQLSLNVELDGISMDDSQTQELIEDLGAVLKTAEVLFSPDLMWRWCRPLKTLIDLVSAFSPNLPQCPNSQGRRS